MELLNKKTVFILLVIILIISAFFRFYKLAEIPPGLYPDVAMNGNDAIGALHTHDFQAFYPENNGREGLFINLIALSFYFFGVSILAIKIVPAIIGTLTILGFYLMTRRLFNNQPNSFFYLGGGRETLLDAKFDKKNYSADFIALLSSFFLAISFWHINFSRLGFRAIMVPFILVWSFYFLFKAARIMKPASSIATDNQQNTLPVILSALYFALAGLFFGLGFHTYIAFRVAPAILGIAFLIEIFNYWQAQKLKKSKSYSLNETIASALEKPSLSKSNDPHRTQTLIILWCVLFAAIIVAALPMAIYFYKNPDDFMSRTGQVSVLASPQPIKGLIISSVKSLGMFNVRGDCNWRHNYACEPALPLSVGILFLFGFFRCLGEILRAIYKWRVPRATTESKSGNWSFAQISLFLIVWFFIMLLPEILTNEGLPHSLRAIGAIPAVYIFSGIGGWWVYEKFKIQNGTSSSQTTAKFKIINQNSRILKILILLFTIWIVLYSYDLYFTRWGKSPETKGAFTQNLVDIGNYLNNLPENTGKYVIVNENGLPVPYPYGVPIPAQTITFVEKTKNPNPGTVYILPDEIRFFRDNILKTSRPIIFALINYDENILSALKLKFPLGIAKNENGIWIFQILKR